MEKMRIPIKNQMQNKLQAEKVAGFELFVQS